MIWKIKNCFELKGTYHFSISLSDSRDAKDEGSVDNKTVHQAKQDDTANVVDEQSKVKVTPNGINGTEKVNGNGEVNGHSDKKTQDSVGKDSGLNLLNG